jgi:hypothetical protein
MAGPETEVMVATAATELRAQSAARTRPMQPVAVEALKALQAALVSEALVVAALGDPAQDQLLQDQDHPELQTQVQAAAAEAVAQVQLVVAQLVVTVAVAS